MADDPAHSDRSSDAAVSDKMQQRLDDRWS